ncbi:electron transfer flavoprotein FixA [Salmonella enterica subsp. enterica]|uniref:Protein AaeX n=2 Tax=Salmonella enterica TaxID=28901 RepID=A0A379UVS7_SALET|nr:electron transfer flavoprotein FixA [Salmonella enterica subsp. enterica]
MSLSPGVSCPSLQRCSLTIYRLLSLRNQGQHESVSVIVVFGLSFPPIFFELLLSLAIFWLVRRMLVPTGIYDFVWHPALFNTALYCCLFYLISRLFV